MPKKYLDMLPDPYELQTSLYAVPEITELVYFDDPNPELAQYAQINHGMFEKIKLAYELEDYIIVCCDWRKIK